MAGEWKKSFGKDVGSGAKASAQNASKGEISSEQIADISTSEIGAKLSSAKPTLIAEDLALIPKELRSTDSYFIPNLNLPSRRRTNQSTKPFGTAAESQGPFQSSLKKAQTYKPVDGIKGTPAQAPTKKAEQPLLPQIKSTQNKKPDFESQKSDLKIKLAENTLTSGTRPGDNGAFADPEDSKVRASDEIQHPRIIMSQRSRPPRGAARVTQDHAGDEMALWSGALEDIQRITDLDARAGKVGQDIIKMEEDFKRREPGKPTVAETDLLSGLYREQVKLAEEIVSIGRNSDTGAVHKLGLLMAVREAAEATAAPSSRGGSSRDARTTSNSNSAAMDLEGPADSPTASPVLERPRGGRDRLLNTSNRNSVPRESSIKHENGGESGTSAGDNAARAATTKVTYALGAEVAFRPKATSPTHDPDWIKGIVVKIIGDNKTRRYDVQDPEPDETSNEPGAVYRTSASSMVPIPPLGAPLPDYPKGKAVLAQYPLTTTFYRAEVVGMSGSSVTLRFEGEEDNNSTQLVDRRFVLDHRGEGRSVR